MSVDKVAEKLRDALVDNIKGVVGINGVEMDVFMTYNYDDGLYQQVVLSSTGQPRLAKEPKLKQQSIRDILVEAHQRIQKEHGVALNSVSFPHRVVELSGIQHVTEVDIDGEAL